MQWIMGKSKHTECHIHGIPCCHPRVPENCHHYNFVEVSSSLCSTKSIQQHKDQCFLKWVLFISRVCLVCTNAFPVKNYGFHFPTFLSTYLSLQNKFLLFCSCIVLQTRSEDVEWDFCRMWSVCVEFQFHHFTGKSALHNCTTSRMLLCFFGVIWTIFIQQLYRIRPVVVFHFSPFFFKVVLPLCSSWYLIHILGTFAPMIFIIVIRYYFFSFFYAHPAHNFTQLRNFRWISGNWNQEKYHNLIWSENENNRTHMNEFFSSFILKIY